MVHTYPEVVRVPVPDLCCLWAEGPTTPMNIALVGVLEGGALTNQAGRLRLDELRAHLAARLDRAPMLRKVLHWTRPGEGLPIWVDDSGFDIARHVFVADPGVRDEAAFVDWCAQRSIVPLDRAGPLWRMEIMPGLPAGRVGVLIVVHHVVADGLRGVALVAGLLDTVPDAPDLVTSWRPQPVPMPTALATDNVRGRLQAAARVLTDPGQLGRRLRAVRTLAAETRSAAPASWLAGPIGAGRRVSVVRRPVAQLREVSHAAGVTINDLLLAAVTTGLRDLLGSRAELTDGLVLRVSVPVGARNGDSGGVLVVPLPVGVPDPAVRLPMIAAETRRRKQHADDGFAAVLTMPATLARLGVAWARRHARSHVDLYVSNVPGPPGPLYLAGARLTNPVPLAPLVAGVPLSVTALSYDGVLSVSLLTDGGCDDLPVLVAGVERGLDQLSQAVLSRVGAAGG